MRRWNHIIFALLLFGCFAQGAPRSQCYDVRLADRPLFCIGTAIGSISAEGRARLIEDKILSLANDYTFDPAEIKITESEGELLIDARELHLVSLRERDLDPEEGMKLQDYAKIVAGEIKSGIQDYRTARSPESIGLGALYTVLAIASLIFILIVLGKGQVFALEKLYALSDRVVARLKIKSYQLISTYRIRQLITVALSAIKLLTIFILIYFYIPLILSFFPWTARWAPQIINYILNPVRHVFSVFFGYAPNLFYIFVILAFTHYALKVVRLIFNEIELGNLTFSGFHKDWAQPTFKLLKFISFAIAFVMIFPYLPGSSSPAFQGLSVFLGVLVSFGSGSAIANMISGIVMTYMRPFKVGDRVQISETIGDVTEKTFLVTRIKTIKNVDVTIPNAMVLGSHIINYSSRAQEDGLILNTTVTIGYDVPWPQVHELLKAAAGRTDLVDPSKKPFIFQTSLDDFYVSYELNVYTRHANSMAVIYSDLRKHILDVFNGAGIEIRSAHYAFLQTDASTESKVDAHLR